MLLSSTILQIAPVVYQAAERDAETLYKDGQAKLGTDEIAVCDILVNRSTPQLIAIVDLNRRNYKSLAKLWPYVHHPPHIVHTVKPKHLFEGVGAWLPP
ncbi:hypothetical protein D9758_011443 [Tetrapyrgos nigripes]|uniref:Uncharacterized protein n=1 Tax=Tetrapyrgos nigripes TaxID=182062 RepID=A0A8H5CRU3_9AGAR|nr:hypothetical protein D9758_011443 [Tetrapyrgos nigripes]